MKKLNELDKLVEKDGKVISFLTHGCRRHYIMLNLLGQFSDKNVMLWQKDNLYYPCKRVQLQYGTDLNYLLENCEEEFDVLIVSSFVENFNSKETIDFIEKVASCEKYKDKQFIFIFTCQVERGDKLTFEHFKNYKDTIEKHSNEIYTISDVISFIEFEMKNLKTKEITKLRAKHDKDLEFVEIINE